ncbi:PLP-dependent aminotransferase family protein [Kitasatospora sp. NE20-6]|uniref:MocR-like pyridoxine biosynthesis transcription factor PdxR n=1 Tax=Kitasatospora sp. NE20-6 TaxID=2859066 RepID=UPI0038B292CB
MGALPQQTRSFAVTPVAPDLLYPPRSQPPRSNHRPNERSNLAWDVFLDLDAQPHGSLRERLTAALRAAIRAGRLAPGAVLPPSRNLAVELRCSRWAVTEAYNQLVVEGHLEARQGSATRVCAPAPQTTESSTPAPAPVRYDLTPGRPDLRAFPNRRWLEALRSTMVTGALTDLAYPQIGGNPTLRELIADYLRRSRGAHAGAADVVITNGVTGGVAHACWALRNSGVTALAVEDPGRPQLRKVAAAQGLEVVGIPVDDEGLRVDHLARHPGLRAVLVTPAHQLPTGAAMSSARRAALLSWAHAADGIVLEDDSYAPFRYGGRPARTLQSLDPDRVLLFGSTSTTLAPAIGIGWLLCPRAWATQFTAACFPPPSGLIQATLARFLETGAYDRHLLTTRNRYRVRRTELVRHLAASLPEARIGGADAGLHLVAHLPARIKSAEVVRSLSRDGVRISDLDTYRTWPDPQAPGLVIGYGNLPDAAVEGAVERIAAVVRIGLPIRHRIGLPTERPRT